MGIFSKLPLPQSERFNIKEARREIVELFSLTSADFSTDVFSLLICMVLYHLISTHRQFNSVGNHGDEFAVGRLASVRLNGVAEI